MSQGSRVLRSRGCLPRGAPGRSAEVFGEPRHDRTPRDKVPATNELRLLPTRSSRVLILPDALRNADLTRDELGEWNHGASSFFGRR